MQKIEFDVYLVKVQGRPELIWRNNIHHLKKHTCFRSIQISSVATSKRRLNTADTYSVKLWFQCLYILLALLYFLQDKFKCGKKLLFKYCKLQCINMLCLIMCPGGAVWSGNIIRISIKLLSKPCISCLLLQYDLYTLFKSKLLKGSIRNIIKIPVLLYFVYTV